MNDSCKGVSGRHARSYYALVNDIFQTEHGEFFTLAHAKNADGVELAWLELFVNNSTLILDVGEEPDTPTRFFTLLDWEEKMSITEDRKQYLKPDAIRNHEATGHHGPWKKGQDK